MHDFSWADEDWIALIIFKNFADHDWIGFNFFGSGLDSDWKISQFAHLCQVSETITDLDWIGLDQDWSQFCPDQDWIGLQFFSKLAKQDWIGWENLCCFSVIILKISKILVVIRFHRFAKWWYIFCHQVQKLSWDYFAIRTVSSFVHI